MSVSSSVNVTELIDWSPVGPLQIRIIVLCGLVALLDGFDLGTIGVAAPAMAGPLHIASNQFGAVFSASVLGLMLGGFVLGPIADRYGRRCVLIAAIATLGVFTSVHRKRDNTPAGLALPLPHWSRFGRCDA
jgi:MFS transporter, AAHS family, 4-hydroxybenzoate transporter